MEYDKAVIRGIPVIYSAFETCAEKLSVDLVKKGHRVVICQGGRMSNQAKKDQLITLGDDFAAAPNVEVSLKPLNRNQTGQIFDAVLDQMRQRARKPIDEDQIKREWGVAQQVMGGAPLLYHMAVSLIHRSELLVGIDQWSSHIESQKGRGFGDVVSLASLRSKAKESPNPSLSRPAVRK